MTNIYTFPQTIQGVTNLPDYIKFNTSEQVPFENIFTAVKDDMIKLLNSMLTLNPASRCTCSQALQMSYFSNDPVPTPPALLPQPKSNSVDDDDDFMNVEKSATKRPNTTINEKLAPTAKRLNFDEWRVLELSM